MKTMRFWNMIVSAVFALLGISFILLSRNFPVDLGTGDPGSGFWPSTLGLILVFLAVLLVGESFFSKQVREKELVLLSEAQKKVYMVMGLAAVFCISTYLLGFVFSSFMFTYVLMSILGITNRKEKLITAFSIIVVIYIIFSVLLNTELPLPIFLR